MSKRDEKNFRGRWRIIESEAWDREALDLVVPAHITFGPDQLGQMEFIAVGVSIDYRVRRRDGLLVVEFSFAGVDEMDPISGRGWARIDGETLNGKIYIHQGDESTFVAERDE